MSIAEEFQGLEEKLDLIEEKVNKLELNLKYQKMQEGWENSPTRILLVTISTYIFVLIFMILLEVQAPYINALLPALAFVITNQSIPFVKRLWIKIYLKRESAKTEDSTPKDIPETNEVIKEANEENLKQTQEPEQN